MNALTAPIQHVQPGEILFAIPFVPLAAAAVNGLFGDRIAAGRGARATNAIALLANLGALAAALSVLYTLYGLPADQRYLFSHLWSFARIASLSASVDLGADPLGSSLACVVMVLALVAHLDLAARDARPSHHARVSLLSGGLALAFFGDGVIPMVLGLGAATVATALLGAPTRARSILVTGALADGALLAGAAVLFWALGGGWGIDVGNEPTFTRHNPIPARVQTQDVDMDESFGPTVLPIAFSGTQPAPSSSAPKPTALRVDAGAKGKITIAGMSGAKLFLRGSNVPAAIAPVIGIDAFAGRMDIEVERPGMPRSMLRAVDVPAYGEIVLVPMGPTLSFRELYDQLALTDVSKKHFVRDLLDPSLPMHRRLFGTSVVNVAGILFAIAAFIRGALFPFLAAGALEGEGDPRARALLFAILPIPAVFLLARVGPVLALGTTASSSIMVFAAISALLAAVIAASRESAMGAIRASIAAQGALALAAARSGAGVVHVVVVALAGMALVLAHDLPGAADKDSPRARASSLATLALAGAPIPVLGVAWSREAVLQRVFGAELPAHLGQLAWLMGVVSVGLVAHALVRVHRASFPSEGASELGSSTRNALFGLFLASAASAIGSVVLVLSQTNLGLGPERPLYETWLATDVGRILAERAPQPIELGRGVELAIACVTIAAAVIGARLARKGEPLFGPSVERVARVPWSLLAGFVEGLGAVGRFVDFILDLPLEIASALARRRR
jgi:NADH-quinone oxidoreductase subunit L